MRICWLVPLFSLVAAGSAAAQIVSATVGEVTVGGKRVSANFPVKPGDNLVAASGGGAVVKYPDGCTIEVDSGKTVSIPAVSPCGSDASRKAAMDRLQKNQNR